tara:strand:+ start:1041 stop:1568 length:528 start_codon:yes stop_codon:yes gene_type:complete
MKNVLLIVGITIAMIVVLYTEMTRADVQVHSEPESFKRFLGGKIVDHYYTSTTVVEDTDGIHLNIKCDTRLVPMLIPGRQARRSTLGETLGGAVIGGVVGKLLTNDDKGAIGGAIIGGLATQDNPQEDRIIYREVSECRDVPRYKVVTEKDYSHSTIDFILDGVSYSARFVKNDL